MREHIGLFRGKRTDNGEWVEGWLYKRIVHLDTCHQNVVVDAIEVYDGESPLSIAYYTVDPDTIGECTGLKDKNGKLIFEGDIVNISDDTGFDMTGVVEYYDCGFELYDEENDGYECLWYEPTVITVLGSVHDNPELLKGGEGE